MADKKIAFVSSELPQKLEEIFNLLGYGCVRLPKFEHLDAPVSCHPDMLFSLLPSGQLLCDVRYYKANENLLKSSGAQFVFSEVHLGKKYPTDICFDALMLNGAVYGKLGFIAPEILEITQKAVNVSQGYTLCSTLVTKRCAITSDGGIAKALQNDGIDTLLISTGGIILSGYGCGFIGGASAYDKVSDTVIFFGNVSEHPSGPAITDFLKAHGHNILTEKSLALSDFGGAKLIKC